MDQEKVNARNSEGYLLRLAKSVIERLSNDSLVSIFRWLELFLYERTGFKVNSSAVTSTLLDESIRNEDEAPYTVGDSSIGVTFYEENLFSAVLEDDVFYCQHCSMPDEDCTCQSCSDCGSNINECGCDLEDML